MSKEQVYDQQVAPLMEQIIRICQENKIAMLASFSLESEDDEGLRCTTALLTDRYEPPDDFKAALGLLKRGVEPSLMALTIVSQPKA